MINVLPVGSRNAVSAVRRIDVSKFEWLEICDSAKQSVRALIPERLSFRVPGQFEDPHTVNMDFDWVVNMVSVLTEEEWGIVWPRAQAAVNFMLRAIDIDSFHRMLLEPQPITSGLYGVSLLNEELHRQDLSREFEREPKFLDLFKHAIGLEACG